ncbi:MAG: RDD family protein [Actinobacteria bacterium]|nr:RDD family protein [Actinomycetota bacterium]
MSEQDPPVPQGAPSQVPPTPPADPAWAAQGPSGPRARFGRRLVAYLIDAILLGIVYVVFAAIFDQAVGYGLSLLIGIAYFGYLEGGASGQTLGKRALGIRVIDFSSGGPIGYGRGVVRYLGRIVSGVVCLLGYLWMLWDKEKQTWHDKIATSVVVPVQYYPVS